MGNISYPWIKTLNIIKIAILLKLIHRFSGFLMKIPKNFLDFKLHDSRISVLSYFRCPQ